jgi:predicted flavoprotein YhiN
MSTRKHTKNRFYERLAHYRHHNREIRQADRKILANWSISGPAALQLPQVERKKLSKTTKRVGLDTVVSLDMAEFCDFAITVILFAIKSDKSTINPKVRRI